VSFALANDHTVSFKRLKILSGCRARRLTFWKVDPTSAFLQLTSNREEIVY
jgi:hypothetical protein